MPHDLPAPRPRPLVVVITGASSGIGRATARHHLARHGAHLALAARFGRIDAWLNNAGVLLLAPFEQAPPAKIRRLLDTDLLGTMHGSQAALRWFRAQGHSILINTGSMLGIVGEPYAGVHAAAKAGIRTLGLCLRQELRDQPAIRVCTLLPMAMDTPIFRRAANYTGREVKAVPPVYDPDLVAKTVLALIRRPRDEVIVGGFGGLLNLGRHLAPGLVEAAIARLGPRLQLGAKPAPPSPGNLLAPIRDGWRRGGWAALPLHPARQWHLATAGLLAALAAGTLLARRGHGHASPERSRAPMNLPSPKPLWTAVEIARSPEARIRHPWNSNSEVHVRPLSQAAGLSRVVLSLARVPPGKESFVHHSHERDEEFLFILSGRGRAEIGEEVFEVGPGDFMGFTAPGVGHHLINPYEEDLVYLMGGERSGLDVGYFPKLKRRIIFSRSGICAVDEAALQTMTFDQWLAGEDASPAATTGDDATGRSDPGPGEPETRPSHAGS